MWMVAAYRQSHSPCWLSWSEVGSRLALSLHSLDEWDELLQFLCHDNVTINVIVIITVIITCGCTFVLVTVFYQMAGDWTLFCSLHCLLIIHLPMIFTILVCPSIPFLYFVRVSLV